MGQEFFINSQELEDKIRQLLPSQGGAGSSFDLSASTQIVPIIDLTESAEGSGLRADLQTSLSHGSCTEFNVQSTTTTVVSNTGYWRVIGFFRNRSSAGSIRNVTISINDGATDKIIQEFFLPSDSTQTTQWGTYDFNVFLKAGDSLKMFSIDNNNVLVGSVRQIATIDGELVNP